MDPDKLRALLAVLTEAGVRRAAFDPCGDLAEVEFGAAPVARPAVFTDTRTGQPVDLSEGAPELADESVDEQIARQNFERGAKH